jgi:hypothetical protein
VSMKRVNNQVFFLCLVMWLSYTFLHREAVVWKHGVFRRTDICVLQLTKTKSHTTVQHGFQTKYHTEPLTDKTIRESYRKFEETGYLCAAKRTGQGHRLRLWAVYKNPLLGVLKNQHVARQFHFATGRNSCPFSFGSSPSPQYHFISALDWTYV